MQNHICLKKCLRCDEILLNGIYEKEHNFLKHYQEGGSLPIELKPINRSVLDRNLQKFSINFDEHSNSYDFTNGKKFPVEFLNVFDTKFNTSGDEKFIFKCPFILINYQLPAVDIGAGVYDSRFWSTKTYDGLFINELIKTSLISDIHKRIIINGTTSSSWRFNRFQLHSISINSTKNQSILR